MKSRMRKLLATVLVIAMVTANVAAPVSAVDLNRYNDAGTSTIVSSASNVSGIVAADTEDLIQKTIAGLVAEGAITEAEENDPTLAAAVEEKSGMTLDQVKGYITNALYENYEMGIIDTESLNLDEATMTQVMDLVLAENYLTTIVDYTLTVDSGFVTSINYEMRESFTTALDEIDEDYGLTEEMENQLVASVLGDAAESTEEAEDAPAYTAEFQWYQTKVENMDADGDGSPDYGLTFDPETGEIGVSTETTLMWVCVGATLTNEETGDVIVLGADEVNSTIMYVSDEDLMNGVYGVMSEEWAQKYLRSTINIAYASVNGVVYTDVCNISQNNIETHFAQTCSFNEYYAKHFGVAAPYWTSKNTEMSPLGTLKALINMQSDDFMPAGDMDYMVEMLTQAFMSYEMSYGSLLDAKIQDCVDHVAGAGNTTEVQKLLMIHDWVANNANFDMSAIINMKAETGSSDPDPAQMTAFGALLAPDGLFEKFDGCICLGYAATYALLVQHVFSDVYQNADGTWKTAEEVGDDYMVDFVQIRFYADIAEVSAAGADSGFGAAGTMFNEPHYYNAVKLSNGNWYYVDSCYDDIHGETISQLRVETNGSISHNYFMFSPVSALEMFEDYMDYIDSAYDGVVFKRTPVDADGDGYQDYGSDFNPVYEKDEDGHVIWTKEDTADEVAYDDTTYEETWFTTAVGEINYYDGYWYYVAGEINSYAAYADMMDEFGDMEGMEDMKDQLGDIDMGSMFNLSGPEYADELVRRPMSAADEPDESCFHEVEMEFDMGDMGGTSGSDMSMTREVYEDPYDEVLFDYGYGTLYDGDAAEEEEETESGEAEAATVADGDGDGSSEGDDDTHVHSTPAATDIKTKGEDGKDQVKIVWDDDYQAKAHYTCANCGQDVSADCTVTSENDATCEKEGNLVYTATAVINGEKHTDTRELVSPATGHKCPATEGAVKFKIGPSEEDPDTIVATASYVCENCEVEQTVEATVKEQEPVPATCTEDGYTKYTASCEIDGVTYESSDDEAYIVSGDPATGHKLSEEKIEDEEGNVTTEVVKPDFKFTEAEDGTVTVTVTYTCGNCGELITVPDKDVTLTSETTDPSNEANGATVYTATVTINGEEYSDTYEVVIERSALQIALQQDEMFQGMYPDVYHTTAIYNNYIYFNIANKIYSISLKDISKGEWSLSELKEYDEVVAYTNGKAFTGMSFFTDSSVGEKAFTVIDHPIAAVSIEDKAVYGQGTNEYGQTYMYRDGETATLTVSIGTNFSESNLKNGEKYKVEAINYNPDYVQQLADEDDNSNAEFMWCANVVDSMVMDDVLNDRSGTKVTVPATCMEPEFTQTRSNTFGLSNDEVVYVEGSEALGHHFAYNAAQECYVCTRCNYCTEDAKVSAHSIADESQITYEWYWGNEDEDGNVALECYATFPCEETGETETVACEYAYVSTTTEATCHSDGVAVYELSFTLGEETHRSKQDVTLPKKDHTYGAPTFDWAAAEDGSYFYAATFACTAEGCDHTEVVECSLTPKTDEDGNYLEGENPATCSTPGNLTMIASCEFEGNTYTNEVTPEQPASDKHLYQANFTWTVAEDGKVSATATLTCAYYGAVLNEVHPVPETKVEISSTTTEGTCTNPTETRYTATATDADGNTYVGLYILKGEKTDHTVSGDPVFTWADDYSSCTITFFCANCCDEGETVTENCKVTSVTEGNKITYTATYGEYSDTKTVETECTEHVITGEPVFKWADDYSSCTITFVCANCCDEGETVTENCKVTSVTEGNKITYTATYGEYSDTKTVDTACTEHKWDSGKVTVEAGYYYYGEKIYTCTVCGETKTEQIANKANPFVDLEEGQYYVDPVLWAVDKGITTGTTATKFAPDTTCTRAQIVTFLWRAAGEPKPNTTEMKFVDVPENAFYYDAVLWAVEKGITTGTTETKFGPDSTCTRAQVVTFLWRYEKEPKPENSTNKFVDVPKDAYYYNAVLWAVEKGITNGTTETKFGPERGCTRGQVVTFLYRNAGEPAKDAYLTKG